MDYGLKQGLLHRCHPASQRKWSDAAPEL